MSKDEQLKKIAKEIDDCEECRVGKSGLPVYGEGSVDAEVVFIGEAPGKTEAETGRPFVGRSGKLLRKLIGEVGLGEDEVFITSVVKFLPDYGTPNSNDIAHGRIHLEKQLEVINPKIIVLLGSVAVQGVLGEKIPIAKEHGKVLENNGRKYLIAFHPAAALRFPPNLEKLKADFEVLKTILS